MAFMSLIASRDVDRAGQRQAERRVAVPIIASKTTLFPFGYNVVCASCRFSALGWGICRLTIQQLVAPGKTIHS